MDENLKIDENTRNVLGAITNDSDEFIKNLRVNPMTGRLLVDAHLTSTNTEIGDTIPGGTAGSVLFLGLGSTLAQDNANFFWDDTNNYLGLGTNTPDSTLEIDGTFHYVDGNQANGYVLTSDAQGNATWQAPTAGSSGYNLVQNNGVSVTQRSTINLSTLLLAADSGGKTALTINTTNLANDNTFVTSLVANTTFTTDLANDSNFYTTLGNNTSFIGVLTSNTTFIGDVVTIVNSDPTISIDLASQVTGILPIANGGTNSATALSGSSIAISNGSAIVQGVPGTTTTVLHGNAAGAPSYSAVSLTADVSGVLPVPNGGTGDSSFTAYAPIFGGTTSTGILQSGTVGTSGQALVSNGPGALPTFQTVTAAIGVTSGIATRTQGSASGTQTIPHGLGVTPAYIKISALQQRNLVGASTSESTAFGTYNGTSTNGIYSAIDTSNAVSSGNSTSNILTIIGAGQTATVTMDATNIYLAWTFTSGSGNSIQMLWEAFT